MPCRPCAAKRRQMIESAKAKKLAEAAKHAGEGLAMMAGLKPKTEEGESQGDDQGQGNRAGANSR